MWLGLILISACTSSPNADRPTGKEPPPSVYRGSGAGWVLDDSAARCVELVSPETLAARDWAFDGTITEVHVPEPDPEDPRGGQPTEVVFSVIHWYKGGTGTAATVKTYNRPGTVSSVGGPDPSVGLRLLASGDDAFLWSCGFSVSYSDEGAADFAEAFGE